MNGQIILELIAENGLTTLLTIAISAACGFFAAQAKRLGKREKAERVILKTIARKEILDAHEKYVIKQAKMSVERYHEIVSIIDAYNSLGEDGSVKPFISDLLAVKPYLITE